MRRLRFTFALLAIVILFSVPVHAEEKDAHDSVMKNVAAARVADHEKLLELEVGPYLKLIFPPDTFSVDTAVTAHLDVVDRQLRITTRGGEISRTAAQIQLALPDLEGGLQIEYDHQPDDGLGFEGSLVEKTDEPQPQIVGLTSDDLEPVVIDNATVVLLSDNKQRTRRVMWSDLAYGDHIRVRYGNGRRATRVEAARMSGEGVVASVDPERFKLVGATTQLAVSPHARFEEADGESFTFESLRPKDRVALRIDPKTREVWHVKRIEAAPGEKAQLVVTHDATGRLLPGDRVNITGTGAPGGTLTIDIVNIESNLWAMELKGDPGTYVLTYTVPRGVSLDETPIVARLELPNQPTRTVLAQEPLLFKTDGAQEGFYEAPDQNKPKTPVVTSPTDGTTIRNTITIAGTAAPNQKVRIAIDYVISRSIVLLGEGRLLETEISTDSRGSFKTKEIPAEVQSLFGGDTDYRITVTAVSGSGIESDPAIVRVRRPD